MQLRRNEEEEERNGLENVVIILNGRLWQRIRIVHACECKVKRFSDRNEYFGGGSELFSGIEKGGVRIVLFMRDSRCGWR